MTEDEVIQMVRSLPGVDVLTAGPENGAPEVAWGDTFFYHDPGGGEAVDRRMPFATIVTSDYPGFDTASDLDRPGVFRVNIGVGRRRFEDLFGHPPAAHAAHQTSYDYAALDRFVPHPVYAVQGWASILNPSEANAARLRSLVTEAHARAAKRHPQSFRASPQN
jgi:hypothetical protein